MNRFLFIAALLTSFNVMACKKPLQMKVGAFFDTASIITYWEDFSTELSTKLGCKVNITPSPTFESFMIDLANKNGDIFMVPGYYAKTLHEHGFQPVLRTITPTKIYLLTSKKYGENNLKSLKDKTIHLSSIYGADYAISKIKFDEVGILNQVSFKFGNTYQTNALNVIKGTADAAVIFSPVFDSMPLAIRDSLNKTILYTSISTGYIMVKSKSSDELIRALADSHQKINLLKWTPSDKSDSEGPLSDVFNQQFLDMKKIAPHTN